MPVLLKSDFLLKAVKGSVFPSGAAAAAFAAAGVCIDSREKSLEGRVFFALKGARFDGHDFLFSAWKKGAAALIISDQAKARAFLKKRAAFKNKSAGRAKNPPVVIAAEDTLKALQELARARRKDLESFVIGITGSSGKTTTRAFTETLLAGLKPFASPKSYNNFIGAPLSILQVNRKKAILIQEIASSAPGEIAFLTELCAPEISALTMAGPSHLEGMGSIERVAAEKKDIYLKSPQALWIFNRDNPLTEKMFQELGRGRSSVLNFSSDKKSADVSLRFLKEDFDSSVIEGRIGGAASQAKAAFSGRPNLENLMCAAAAALGAGLKPEEIWKRIPFCRLPEGRGRLIKIKEKNISIFFDAYNANPASMDFFLQSCGRFAAPDQRLFVLGDMKELGKDSVFYHKKLAANPALLSARFIAFIGECGPLLEKELKAKGFKGRFVRAPDCGPSILSALKEEMREGDFLAFKASRSLRLERLLYDLTGFRVF